MKVQNGTLKLTAQRKVFAARHRQVLEKHHGSAPTMGGDGKGKGASKGKRPDNGKSGGGVLTGGSHRRPR